MAVHLEQRPSAPIERVEQTAVEASPPTVQNLSLTPVQSLARTLTPAACGVCPGPLSGAVVHNLLETSITWVDFSKSAVVVERWLKSAAVETVPTKHGLALVHCPPVLSYPYLK